MSVLLRESPALLNIRGNSDEASKWSLYALDPAPDYAAALAVYGSIDQLYCWQWR